MIAEPYICTEVSTLRDKIGEIAWFQVPCKGWLPYADFEREKLCELKSVATAYNDFKGITISCIDCYWILLHRLDCKNKICKFPWQTLYGDSTRKDQHCHYYGSAKLIGYTPSDYDNDSDSGRLLKRAEFLKAVCDREKVEWLPSMECSEDMQPRDCLKHECDGENDEKAFRRDLLYFLSIPNIGVTKGEYIDAEEYRKRFDYLCKKYL